MLPIQGDDVDYIDFMIVKAVVICLAAIVYGFYMGITGR